MRPILAFCALVFLARPASAQNNPDGPTDEKAKKTYANALEETKSRSKLIFALDDFKKADKQDGGHCKACQQQMVKYGIELGEWKTAELGATEMIAEAKESKEIALARYRLAAVLVNEGKERHKEQFFSRAHEEIEKALAAVANFPDAIYLDGVALASTGQDEPAKARFEQFVKVRPAEDPQRQRAERFIARPELVRAKMVPNF